MRRIKGYQLVDHFVTRGTIPLGFDDVASGVGSSPVEAVQSALEILAGNGWDVDGLLVQILADRDWDRGISAHGSSYFVSVYVR
jgi:hypothetical protein